MKTRGVPVLIVLVAAVFASSDLTGELIVLDVPGANDTFPRNIDGNNVVGYFQDAIGTHGFLYNGTDYTILDSPGTNSTILTGIDGNNVVGMFNFPDQVAPYGDHGFLYDGMDYTTLDVPGADYTRAEGIDGNNVVGWFSDGSRTHGFIWTQLLPDPLPEPSILIG